MRPMVSEAKPRRLSEELVDMEEEDRRVSLEEDEGRRERERRREERRFDNGDAKTWTSRDNLSETSTPQGTIIAPPRSHRGTEPTEMKTTARHGTITRRLPGRSWRSTRRRVTLTGRVSTIDPRTGTTTRTPPTPPR